MDVADFLEKLRGSARYQGQMVHARVLDERPARTGTCDPPLPAQLTSALTGRGITGLFTHQVRCLELARQRHDAVVVTGTASGKTLAYNLPIFERCLANPAMRALYLYPTKALAQDQLKGLLTWTNVGTRLNQSKKPGPGAPTTGLPIVPGVYAGATPPAQRKRIQAEANLVLSNPDMLHASILPYHSKWARFFAGLAYVVIDETHTYRGILGAHVACVLRRLWRVCEHYGSAPVVLAASATIANPAELVERLIGRPVAVVDEDGAPRGRKHFVFWNPACNGSDQLSAASATDDSAWILAQAVEADAQALVFTRTRQAAELVHRYVEDDLTRRKSRHAKSVKAYRGGYLPEERRAVEQALAAGELRGVAATNALELGIDIGSLDVAILSGYPGTIASTWQQAGRSGRRQGESLAVLVAGNDPIDHYLLRHPDYFFAQSPEQAVVDPENPYVLARHLKCAAFELPLDERDESRFGQTATEIICILQDAGDLNQVAGKHYFAGGQNPSARISLRHMSDNTISIVEVDHRRTGTPAWQRPVADPERAHRVIANVDSISAPELVYPEAVYLHGGETYLVRHLDLEGKVAYVERRETDYYTQAILDSTVRIVREQARRAVVPGTMNAAADVCYGGVDVSWKTVAFKKLKFQSRDSIGLGPVDIPAQSLDTTGVWLVPDGEARRAMKASGHRVAEGLVGVRNLATVALPFIAMCDSRDLGGVVNSHNTGASTLILYDRYPGGLGYCERAYGQMEQLLALCRAIIRECPCEEGCPSCVGLPNLRPGIHTDPDLMRGYPLPDKASTIRLLDILCGLGDESSIDISAHEYRPPDRRGVSSLHVTLRHAHS